MQEPMNEQMYKWMNVSDATIIPHTLEMPFKF
jgi:hypothetical protein